MFRVVDGKTSTALNIKLSWRYFILAPFKYRNFTQLWLGGLISMIGNWILIAALPFHVYAITGSALASSGVVIAYIVPVVIFGSIAGVFVDRWDNKKTMLIISFHFNRCLVILSRRQVHKLHGCPKFVRVIQGLRYS